MSIKTLSCVSIGNFTEIYFGKQSLKAVGHIFWRIYIFWRKYIYFGEYIYFAEYIYFGEYIDFGEYIYFREYIDFGEYITSRGLRTKHLRHRGNMKPRDASNKVLECLHI